MPRFGGKPCEALPEKRRCEYEYPADGSNRKTRPETDYAFVQVFSPPKFETVTERITTREASERLEIVPAEFEWVEKLVEVKEASTQWVEVPAEYEWVEVSVVVQPGFTSWELTDTITTSPDAKTTKHYELVVHPPIVKTVRSQVLVKPASQEAIEIPAEFETIRIQRIVKPASSRRIEIPAQFETIEKQVLVDEGGLEWKCTSGATDQQIYRAILDDLKARGAKLSASRFAAIIDFAKQPISAPQETIDETDFQRLAIALAGTREMSEIQFTSVPTAGAEVRYKDTFTNELGTAEGFTNEARATVRVGVYEIWAERDRKPTSRVERRIIIKKHQPVIVNE